MSATHIASAPVPYRKQSPRRGMTLTEVMVSTSILVIVSASMMGLMSAVGRMHKGIFSQQRILKNAKQALDGPYGVNSEIRLATAPLTLDDTDGDGWSNVVRFSRPSESVVREFRLDAGPDGDMSAPHDNRLIYDPDIAIANNEVVVMQMIMPDDPARGAFSYTSALTPLVFQARVGDALGHDSIGETGQGIQGAEINVTIAPRN